MKISPTSIHQIQSGELFITWSDNHRSLFAAHDLRMHCPCAQCVDEWTGEKILKENQIPADIRFRNFQESGHYGIKIAYSDGHSTGIYSWEYLRDICRCVPCTENTEKSSGENPPCRDFVK